MPSTTSLVLLAREANTDWVLDHILVCGQYFLTYLSDEDSLGKISIPQYDTWLVLRLFVQQ